MPFKGVDVMDVKKEFVLKSLDKNVNFTELCREYIISTKTRKPLNNNKRDWQNILSSEE